jgi:ABC-type lipoprotein export system ATPase subunit
VIFADEPTGNLDSKSGREVLSFLRRSVNDFGQTVVMVTHDPVAASYADRAVVLADGRIEWTFRCNPRRTARRPRSPRVRSRPYGRSAASAPWTPAFRPRCL